MPKAIPPFQQLWKWHLAFWHLKSVNTIIVEKVLWSERIVILHVIVLSAKLESMCSITSANYGITELRNLFNLRQAD